MIGLFCRKKTQLFAVPTLDEQPEATLIVLDKPSTIDVENELNLQIVWSAYFCSAFSRVVRSLLILSLALPAASFSC